MRADLATLFSRSVVNENGCRIWQGAIKSNGYGHASVDGKTVGVHRLSWSLFNGRKIPKNMRVLHSCDVRPCIEPSHLRLGTAAENSQEMVLRKRYKGPRRLTNEQIGQIIELCSQKTLSQRKIGEMFNVSQVCISKIHQGKMLATYQPGNDT